MKRFLSLLCAVLAIVTVAEVAQADTGSLHYGGYQPWWNIFAKRNRYMSAEEERLQRFWHDYYDALRRYYSSLDHIDWVSYYKNHGYQINTGCAYGQCGGSQRVQFAPVFVSPTMQWAVPNSQRMNGPPSGQSGPPMGRLWARLRPVIRAPIVNPIYRFAPAQAFQARNDKSG